MAAESKDLVEVDRPDTRGADSVVHPSDVTVLRCVL